MVAESDDYNCDNGRPPDGSSWNGSKNWTDLLGSE